MTSTETGHGHGHHHQDDLDWATMAAQLERGAELDLPYLRGAADWLAATVGGDVRRVLDVGSGPGVVTCVLAEAFPAAEVVAVDGTAELLEHVERRAARLGVADRVTTRLAELPEAFDQLGAADLVWTSHVLHHLGDQQAAVSALTALLRPGGRLAVAEGGLTTRYLPRDFGLGRPGLQARIDVAREAWFTDMRASLPGTADVVEDWPAMLARSGLDPVESRSFLTDLPAPAGASVREYLFGNLEREREHLAEHLDGEDLATVDRLLDRDADDGLMHRPDVFLLTASTVHTGSR